MPGRTSLGAGSQPPVWRLPALHAVFELWRADWYARGGVAAWSSRPLPRAGARGETPRVADAPPCRQPAPDGRPQGDRVAAIARVGRGVDGGISRQAA